MRVPHAGESVHVGLEGIFAASLVGALQLAFVAAAQVVFDDVVFSTVQALGQHCVFDAFDPELVQCGAVGFPGRFGAVNADLVVAFEVQVINALVDQRQGKLEALDNPLLHQVVDIKAWLQLAGFQGRAQAVTDVGECVDVLLSQVNALVVQVVQVGIKHIARKFVTNAQITEMGELKLAGNQDVGPGLVNGGRDRLVNSRVIKLCLQTGQSRHQQGKAQCCAKPRFFQGGLPGAVLSDSFRNAHKCIPGDTGCLVTRKPLFYP